MLQTICFRKLNHMKFFLWKYKDCMVDIGNLVTSWSEVRDFQFNSGPDEVSSRMLPSMLGLYRYIGLRLELSCHSLILMFQIWMDSFGNIVDSKTSVIRWWPLNLYRYNNNNFYFYIALTTYTLYKGINIITVCTGLLEICPSDNVYVSELETSENAC